jgi:hypothetical protein
VNKWALALFVVGNAFAAEPHDLARYQIIVDRSPFGPVTVTGVPDAMPNFAQRFKLVGIVTSTGLPVTVQAVLSDKETNRTWFKAEGELIDDGVKVVRIQDALTSKAKVVLQFGLETATLTFAERSHTPVATASQPAPQPAPGAVPVRQPNVGRITPRRSN